MDVWHSFSFCNCHTVYLIQWIPSQNTCFLWYLSHIQNPQESICGHAGYPHFCKVRAAMDEDKHRSDDVKNEIVYSLGIILNCNIWDNLSQHTHSGMANIPLGWNYW